MEVQVCAATMYVRVHILPACIHADYQKLLHHLHVHEYQVFQRGKYMYNCTQVACTKICSSFCLIKKKKKEGEGLDIEGLLKCSQHTCTCTCPECSLLSKEGVLCGVKLPFFLSECFECSGTSPFTEIGVGGLNVYQVEILLCFALP